MVTKHHREMVQLPIYSNGTNHKKKEGNETKKGAAVNFFNALKETWNLLQTTLKPGRPFTASLDFPPHTKEGNCV